MNSKTAGPKRDRLAEVVRVMVNSINKLVRCRHIDEDCMQGTCSNLCKRPVVVWSKERRDCRPHHARVPVPVPKNRRMPRYRFSVFSFHIPHIDLGSTR